MPDHSAALAATEAADSAAVAASLYLAARLATTEAADTPSFAAALSTGAALAATETADSAAFVANHVHLMALAVSEAPDRATVLISPYWPAALPLPTLAGYGLKPTSAVQRLPLEIGAPRVYRRTRRPLAEVTVVWQVDNWQQMLLDGFYSSVADEGGRWFGITLGFPSGLSLVSARFKEKVAFKALGGARWQASATLEILQRPVMDDMTLTARLDDEGDPPAWPATLLPKPLASSWELQPKPAVVRSDDGTGLPQQRRRSRNSTAEVEAAWELTADQAALFDGFFRWRGRDGAQWFDFPLWQGLGTVMTKVRFLGDADWTPRAGGHWMVSAPIEIRQREVLSASELAIAAPIDPDDLSAALDELHDVVNKQILAES